MTAPGEAAQSQRTDLRIAFGMGLMFLVLGLLGAVGSWRAWRLDTGIVAAGERAAGQVTRTYVLPDGGGDSDYRVDYWFDLPDGRRLQASRGVTKALWQTFGTGQAVVVHYAADNPKRNFPAGGGVTSIGVVLFIGVFSMLFAGFGALLLAGAWRTRRASRN